GGGSVARVGGVRFCDGGVGELGVGGGGGGCVLDVSVANAGNVATVARDSAGIYAQSIGGGGGAGGGALAMDVSLMGGKAVAHGGSGGGGGAGGQVSVNCIDYGSVSADAAACAQVSYTLDLPAQPRATELR